MYIVNVFISDFDFVVGVKIISQYFLLEPKEVQNAYLGGNNMESATRSCFSPFQITTFCACGVTYNKRQKSLFNDNVFIGSRNQDCSVGRTYGVSRKTKQRSHN